MAINSKSDGIVMMFDNNDIPKTKIRGVRGSVWGGFGPFLASHFVVRFS